MQFVIIGYGRVGNRTARILGEEGHDLTIVETDPDKVSRAETAGFDVIAGDGSEEQILREAGIEDADAIGALTGDLSINYTACMIADEFDCRTVLRIDRDYREEIYEKYAADVDDVIYPERLGAAGAKTALLGGDFNVIADLAEHLTLTTVRVPADADIVGSRVVELDLPGDAQVYAHGGAKEAMSIPLPSTEIAANDQLALLSTPDELEDARERLTAT
jgi:trk system potassium uptake protein TrkA